MAGRRSTSGSAAVLRVGAHSNTEHNAARGGARPLGWGESSRSTRRAADQQGSWLGRDGDDEKRRRRAWAQRGLATLVVPRKCKRGLATSIVRRERERERKERNSLTGGRKLTSKGRKEGRSGGGGSLITNRRFHPERASSTESCRQHGSRGRGLVL